MIVAWFRRFWSWVWAGGTGKLKAAQARKIYRLIEDKHHSSIFWTTQITFCFVLVVFLRFLKRMLKQMKGREVFVIVDGHPVHKAKLVKAWFEERKDLIELFFLPSYSAELNPIVLTLVRAITGQIRVNSHTLCTCNIFLIFGGNFNSLSLVPLSTIQSTTLASISLNGFESLQRINVVTLELTSVG